MRTLNFWLLLILVNGLISCEDTTTDKPEELEGDLVTEVTTSPFDINFNAFAPKDLPANASDIELVKFAWEEFIALNWKSSFTHNRLRDYPDTSWNFGIDNAPYPDLVVWETYAHRTELRPYNDTMLPFNDRAHYNFGTSFTQGTTAPGQPFSPFLFNNLDENNEIGSCDLYAHVDKYKEENMVLYQAKCNRDEYEYIQDNYKTKAALLGATSKTMLNIGKDSAYYSGATSTCDCPKSEGVLCLPCGGSPNPNKPGETYQGAMEIKTAWRMLKPEDTASKYFTRNVIYYTKNEAGGIAINNGIFALIGIHIIHKTKNYPAFVFATWEHVDVQNDNMGYVLLNSDVEEVGKIHANYPRLYTIPAVADSSTSAVHRQIKAKNPNSIWLNYRLVGVQAQPSSDTTSTSFFLANYVIESDTTLAHFQGSKIGTPHDKGNNVLLDKQFYSQGGCQGCHGAAQLRLGTDFSFLLDTVGKPVEKPDLLGGEVKAEKLAKLKSYIKTMGNK